MAGVFLFLKKLKQRLVIGPEIPILNCIEAWCFAQIGDFEMKFDLYQIQYSEADRAEINAGKINRKREIRSDMMCDFKGTQIAGLASEAFDDNLYTKVSTIIAEDWNDAFEVGNIGPENQIIRHGRMASVSVGDILVDEEGQITVVANVGFYAIGFQPKIAA